MFKRCLFSLLAIILIAPSILPQIASANSSILQNSYISPDSEKSGQTRLAELIEQEAKEKVLVTVDGQQYGIVWLKRKVNTATLRPEFGVVLFGEVKVYVDSLGNPVSDPDIVRKIKCIDFARRSLSRQWSTKNISEALDNIDVFQREVVKIRLLGASLDILVSIGATAVRTFVTGGTSLVEDIAKEAPEEAIMLVTDPVNIMLLVGHAGLDRAKQEYQEALNIAQSGDITDYETAYEFLSHCLTAWAESAPAFDLLSKSLKINKTMREDLADLAVRSVVEILPEAFVEGYLAKKPDASVKMVAEALRDLQFTDQIEFLNTLNEVVERLGQFPLLTEYEQGRQEGYSRMEEFFSSLGHAGEYTLALAQAQAVVETVLPEKALPANQIPIAKITGKLDGQEIAGQESADLTVEPGEDVWIYLSASSSADLDGKIKKYEWYLDGKYIGDTRDIRGQRDPGSYEFLLVVADDQGLESQARVTISINEVPAEATPLPVDLPPSAPSNLSATATSSNQINLLWQDNSDNELGFKVERRTGATGGFIEIANLDSNVITYSDTGLAENTACFYRVTAYNVAGSSAYTNEVSATTLITPMLEDRVLELAEGQIGRTRGSGIFEGIPWVEGEYTYCDRFVSAVLATASGKSLAIPYHSGYETAFEHYSAHQSLVKQGNPPRGAVVYYDKAKSNDFGGHVGICDGQGNLISVVNATEGVLPARLNSMGAPMLGWIKPSEYYIVVPQPTLTYKAQFIGESYPDNTEVAAGEEFTKTWTIENIGTATWDSSCRLKYFSGDLSLSRADIPISGTVAPGQEYTFSVAMRAPTTPSTYTEYWQLLNPSGDVITVDNSGTIWAEITVLQPTPTSDYQDAQWIPADPNNFSVSNRGTQGIQYIVIHAMYGTLKDTVGWFRNPNPVQTSAHYLIGENGQVVQMVREKDIAHHAGVEDHPINRNLDSIGIELEDKQKYQTEPWVSEEMYQASAKLVRYLTEKYNIPQDRNHIIGHNEVPGSTKKDPGEYWDWDYFIALVREEAPTVDKFPNVTSFSASASSIDQGQSVTLYYSVSDDKGLRRVELWRADDSAGIDFREINRNSISGKSYSGSFSDTPSPGTYRYGLHVVDTAGEWNCERNSRTDFSPGVYGPIQVIVPEEVETVTLTLYVHEGSASGAVIVGVQVTGQDGAGNSFSQTTNTSGYMTITGVPGTWQFTASKSGYETIAWSQDITVTDRKDAYFPVAPLCWSTGPLSNSELANLVKQHFPDGIVPQTGENIWVTAYAVARAESGGNPTACGDDEKSIGLWQIHTGFHPEYDKERLFDPDYNAEVAAQLSNNGIDWNSWCTWEKCACGGKGNETYKQWLEEARTALGKVEQKPNPPTIISPGSNSEPGPIIDTLTPTLTWTAVSGADYYALAISKYPYGSSYIAYNPQQLIDASHTVPDGILEPGQKYRWNMQAHGLGGWSAISNILYFQTQGVQPPAISVISPNGGERWKVDSAQIISWEAGGDTSKLSYVKIAYSTDGGSSFTNITEQAFPITWSYSWTIPDTPSTQCLIRVRAMDTQGYIQVSDIGDGNFTIYKETPAGARIVVTSSLRIVQSPPYYVDQTITAQFSVANRGDTAITLKRLLAGGRLGGEVEDFEYVANLTLSPGASYNYQGNKYLTRAGDYHFFVAYLGPDDRWNISVPTEEGAVNVLDINVGAKAEPPSAPTIISPGSNSEPGPIIDTLTPTLTWTAVSGADYYALAISKYPYGSSYIAYNPQQLIDASHTVPDGILEPGQKYRWNMQAHGLGGWSAISNTLYFQTKEEVQTPTVETKSAVDIAEMAATINGRVISDCGSSIIERRFDWGTTSSCTGGWTASVSVSGSDFSYRLTGLEPGTTYYFRAWAKNSVGWSNGSVLSFTTQTRQDNPPNVTSFSVSASNIDQGQSVTLYYSVSDDVGLRQVELWRADDSAGIDFREIKRLSISGTSYSDFFSDTPPSPGTYRYGLHVVDTNGEWNCERNSRTDFSPGVYGPIQVTVVALTPQITGVDPSQPIAQPTRQWLTILGTSFDPQSQVILRIGGSEYPIPSDRTQFVSSGQIKVYVGLTDLGAWSAQVVNPGGYQSNIFSFQVIP